MEKIYRVQENGIDVENSATNCKNVAFSHASSLFSEDPSSIFTVVSSEVVESIVATFSSFNCRLRVGDSFELFYSIDDLYKRVAEFVVNRVDFTIMF